jgi:hypothetical protein
MVFQHGNWIKQEGKYASPNPDARKKIAGFLLRQAGFRLSRSNDPQETAIIGKVLNELFADITEEDLKPLVVDIPGSIIKDGSITGSPEAVTAYFEMLELFFRDRPCLVVYKDFSAIDMHGNRFSEEGYITLVFKIFNRDNWEDSTTLSVETKIQLKDFILRETLKLLPDIRNRDKIDKNREILKELHLTLVPEDFQRIIEAVKSSPYIDAKQETIKNGEAVENHIDTLLGFGVDTGRADYYGKFAEIRMGRHNFSDFSFVSTALDILDNRNWDDEALKTDVRERIKKIYFNTFLNPKLSREDKVSNLNILHNRLKIAITEQEKYELGGEVKNTIEELVDLVDTMEALVGEATDSQRTV